MPSLFAHSIKNGHLLKEVVRIGVVCSVKGSVRVPITDPTGTGRGERLKWLF